MRSTPRTTTRRGERSDEAAAGGVAAEADPSAALEDVEAACRPLDDDRLARAVDALSACIAGAAGERVADARTVTLSRNATCPALVSRSVPLHAPADAAQAITNARTAMRDRGI